MNRGTQFSEDKDAATQTACATGQEDALQVELEVICNEV